MSEQTEAPEVAGKRESPSTFREAVLARLPRTMDGDETIIQDGIAMDAVLQLAYFGGGDVTIGIGGGHDTIYRAYWGRGGNAEGSWESVRDALIAAAEQARHPDRAGLSNIQGDGIDRQKGT